MATMTEAEKKAAADAVKKTPVVPKEMRERLLRGQEVPVETPEAKAKREADEKTAKDKAAADAKEKTEREAKEAEEKKRKKERSDLPPIPAAAAPPPGLTKVEVEKIVADARTTPPIPAAHSAALNPEDKTDLELAEFAAKQHPDRYADLPQRVTAWVPKRDGHLEAKAKELGGRESAEFRDYVNGEEYRRFVRENAPTYQRGDAKKVYEEFIEERGAQRTMAKIRPELDAMKQQQLRIEQTPIIERMVAEGASVMLQDTDATPDEALVEFKKDPTAFAKSNEIEGGIIVRYATFFTEAIRETLRITSGLVDVAKLKNPTPTQAWIDQFILGKEQEMQRAYPNGYRLPDGTILVSEVQLQQLKAANVPGLSSYRTMLPAEIAGAIAVEGRLEIKRQLAAEREKWARSGLQRVKKVEAAPNGEKSAPSGAEGSPMAGAAPARGAGGAAPPPNAPYWKKYTDGSA